MYFGLVCQNDFGTDCMSSINKKKEKNNGRSLTITI